MLVIKSIEVSNFRKLKGPVCIEGLGEGLTIIAGDNEEGKSTLLEAVRAALFEKYNLTGDVADSFQPYGSSVRPEVAVGFSLNGDLYRIEKGFCQKPTAELTTPSGSFSGPAAEDKLKELLGYTSPGRGASKPEHQGIWGMLFVQQGTAFQPIPVNESGQRTLRTALEAQVGDVLGGPESEKLISSVKEAFDRYYTPTGRAKGELKQVHDEVASLEAELVKIDGQLREFDQKLDELEKLEQQLTGPFHPDRMADLQGRLEAASRAAKELESLEQALTHAAQVFRVAEVESQQAQQQWDSRQRLVKSLEDNAKSLEAYRESAARIARQLETLDSQVTEQQERSEHTQSAVLSARSELKLLQSLRNARDIDAQLNTIRQQLQKAQEAETGIRDTKRTLSTVELPKGALDRLRSLSKQIDHARAKRSAVATTLALELNSPPEMGGQILEPSAQVEIFKPETLNLGQQGRITITPGGANVSEILAELTRLERELSEFLDELGVPGLAEAEDRGRREQELKSRLATEQVRLSAIAPDGLENLKERVDELETRLSAINEQLDDRGEEQRSVDDQKIHEAEDKLRLAEAQEKEARLLLDEARVQRETILSAQAEAQAALKSNQSDADRLTRDLESARSDSPDQTLHAEVKAADQGLLTANEAHENAKKALEQADPEAIRSDLVTAERAIRHFTEQQNRINSSITEIRGELRGRGNMGLGEQRQDLMGRLEAARFRSVILDRQAGAIGLLHQVLDEAAGEAREHFLHPISERVAPLLRRLFPDQRLVLGDDLDIACLDRDGIKEPFSSLSVGTREQLSILTRLAFAQLLVEQGHPAMVILDDALVYSDHDRFERMKLILSQAAQHYQILLLTCRPGDYLSVGAPVAQLPKGG